MGDYNRSRLITALEKFNEGKYFDAHEIIEDIWFDVRDNSRDFYQGLLHAAVAFYHLIKKNNFKGTLIQIEKAVSKLDLYGDLYLGVDLLKLKKQLISISIKLKKKEVPKRLPKIILK